MKKLFSLMLLFGLIQTACQKDELVEQEPQLQFTVIDEKGMLVHDAEITLYGTYEDWFDMMNPLDSGVTNSTGQYKFENLQEAYYFFDVEYDEIMGNTTANSSLESPLKRGYLTNITVILKKYYDDEE